MDPSHMSQTHSRITDTTPVVMYLHADRCAAADTATYLGRLGIQMVEADLSGSGYSTEVCVADVPVLLMGNQVLDWPDSFNTLCGQLEHGGDDRLIIVMTDRTVTFDER